MTENLFIVADLKGTEMLAETKYGYFLPIASGEKFLISSGATIRPAACTPVCHLRGRQGRL